ncbi:MAG: hypothetical protein DHS80DRAFT_22000 [Piptocephalis tieghemiana]|nr:MAG: hypothetical protein DHS80DRAFT_22000 [Piptocephalis tieghemiana]
MSTMEYMIRRTYKRDHRGELLPAHMQSADPATKYQKCDMCDEDHRPIWLAMYPKLCDYDSTEYPAFYNGQLRLSEGIDPDSSSEEDQRSDEDYEDYRERRKYEPPRKKRNLLRQKPLLYPWASFDPAYKGLITPLALNDKPPLRVRRLKLWEEATKVRKEFIRNYKKDTYYTGKPGPRPELPEDYWTRNPYRTHFDSGLEGIEYEPEDPPPLRPQRTKEEEDQLLLDQEKRMDKKAEIAALAIAAVRKRKEEKRKKREERRERGRKRQGPWRETKDAIEDEDEEKALVRPNLTRTSEDGGLLRVIMEMKQEGYGPLDEGDDERGEKGEGEEEEEEEEESEDDSESDEDLEKVIMDKYLSDEPMEEDFLETLLNPTNLTPDPSGPGVHDDLQVGKGLSPRALRAKYKPWVPTRADKYSPTDQPPGMKRLELRMRLRRAEELERNAKEEMIREGERRREEEEKRKRKGRTIRKRLSLLGKTSLETVTEEEDADTEGYEQDDEFGEMDMSLVED